MADGGHFPDAKTVAERKEAIVFFVFLIWIGAGLFASISPGVYVTDEGVYLMMVDSLVEGGSLMLYDGLPTDAPQLEFVEMVEIRGDSIVGQYPKLYAVLMALPYMLFGSFGITAANTLAYLGTLALIYALASGATKDRRAGIVSAIIYCFATYSPRFALEIWPHSISVFAITAAVYLALAACKSSSPLPLVGCGIACGIAFGIRYATAFQIAAILIFLAFERMSLKSLAAYSAGAAIPLMMVFLLNATTYDSASNMGYEAAWDDFGSAGHFLVFGTGFALLLLWYAWDKSLGGSLPRRGSQALVGGAILVFLASGGLESDMASSFQVFYSEIVDIGAFPAGGDIVPNFKMSLLQASPILILSFAGLAAIFRRGGTQHLRIFALTGILDMVFLTGRITSHGGETPFMRYFLNDLPFLSIFAGIYVAKAVEGLSIRGAAPYLGMGMLLLLASVLPYGDGVAQDNMDFKRFLPLGLALMTLISFIAFERARGPWSKRAVLAALCLCLAYTVSVNVWAISQGQVVRQMTYDASQSLDFMDEGSLVLYDHTHHRAASFTQLSVDRGVHLANAGVSPHNESLELIGAYVDSGADVYVISSSKVFEENGSEWMHYVEEELPKAFKMEAVGNEYFFAYAVKGRL